LDKYSTTVTYGWIEKGTDVELPAQTGRKRVNLNGALDADSHEIIVSEHETLDAHAFIALMERLEAINEMGEVIYIVLDNARYYKNIDVKTYVETSRIQLLFLPPYSPNLNLIERVWKFLKQKLLYNRYFETFDQFRYDIKEFLKSANIKFTDELDSLLEVTSRSPKATY
jgi:transposase